MQISFRFFDNRLYQERGSFEKKPLLKANGSLVYRDARRQVRSNKFSKSQKFAVFFKKKTDIFKIHRLHKLRLE